MAMTARLSRIMRAQCPWCDRKYWRRNSHNRVRCWQQYGNRQPEAPVVPGNEQLQEDMMGGRPDPAGTPGSQPGGSEDNGTRDKPDTERQPGKGDEQKPPGR